MTAEYHLGKVLGRGQFGTTRLAEHKKAPSDANKTFACKSIAKRKLTCVCFGGGGSAAAPQRAQLCGSLVCSCVLPSAGGARTGRQAGVRWGRGTGPA